MSAYSTLDITREDGIKLAIKKIFETSDEDLLFSMYGSRYLHNFSVISDYENSNSPYKDEFFA